MRRRTRLDAPESMVKCVLSIVCVEFKGPFRTAHAGGYYLLVRTKYSQTLTSASNHDYKAEGNRSNFLFQTEFYMKKIISALAAVALMVPSVASASTASESLSVKSASVKPVRAAAKSGKAKLAPAIIIGLIATAAIVGGAVAIANNDSDSN